ncbi:armadillo-type protein [Schizophyllum amplum]|uniref:Armadillo-type protein n=1 Tax=Schizophyllum amplum TaxID=97359 RepID=A0A550CN54_9AGAR|nr:armadillo-type protein [Auriculariopsis ampla]
MEKSLDAVLKKLASDTALLPDEINTIVLSFASTEASETRSRGYLTLSAYCQAIRKQHKVTGKHPDPATEALASTFTPEIRSGLEETDPPPLLTALNFFTALFAVDGPVAATVLQKDGILELIMDIVDLNTSPEMGIAVAHLLAQAAGDKQCRTLLAGSCREWIEGQFRTAKDPGLKAAAAVTLVKLTKGGALDAAEAAPGGLGATVTEDPGIVDEEDLASAMRSMLLESGDRSTALADEVEVLAYLSSNPSVKDMLSRDDKFLRKLFALVPQRKKLRTPEADTTLIFGVVAIAGQLCAYKPRLTEEQAQMEKLRTMARAKQGKEQDTSSALDEDEEVKARVRRLVAAGVLDVFPAALSLSSSRGMQVNIARALLCIIEDKENRGKVLQSGGGKVLMTLIKQTTSTENGKARQTSELDPPDLEAIQALAKLAITASPVQVFGPNEGTMIDVIRPFSALLQHNNANLLQRFEALMALTNLASQSPELAARVSTSEGLLNKLEMLLLQDHALVRRAAVELLCNLVAGSDSVYERYQTKSRLHVLLALSDVEDLPTRLASAGALATLTASPSASQEKHNVSRILARLIDPTALEPSVTEEEAVAPEQTDPGLVHRGVVIVRNLLLHCGSPDLQKAMVKEVKAVNLHVALIDLLKAQQSNPPSYQTTAGHTVL